MNNVTGVIRLLKKEQDRLTKELRGIGAALAAFGNAYGNGTGTRKVKPFSTSGFFASGTKGGSLQMAEVQRFTQSMLETDFR